MCEGSIHVPHRLATGRERLVLKEIPRHGMKGFYPAFARSSCPKLVCVRGAVPVVIHEVRFHKDIAKSSPFYRKWNGKKDVKVVFHGHNGYIDHFAFVDENGKQMNLQIHMFAEGMRVDIGIVATERKARGMKLVECAVREALALPPEPKPEDEDKNNGDKPADDQPAEERQPEQPTAA